MSWSFVAHAAHLSEEGVPLPDPWPTPDDRWAGLWITSSTSLVVNREAREPADPSSGEGGAVLLPHPGLGGVDLRHRRRDGGRVAARTASAEPPMLPTGQAMAALPAAATTAVAPSMGCSETKAWSSAPAKVEGATQRQTTVPAQGGGISATSRDTRSEPPSTSSSRLCRGEVAPWWRRRGAEPTPTDHAKRPTPLRPQAIDARKEAHPHRASSRAPPPSVADAATPPPGGAGRRILQALPAVRRVIPRERRATSPRCAEPGAPPSSGPL